MHYADKGDQPDVSNRSVLKVINRARGDHIKDIPQLTDVLI